MSLTKNDRTIQPPSGKGFPPASFAEAIGEALHRQYDNTHAGVKTVVTLTGANERAVRNWFDAKNGPNGEFLIALCRHSDEVLDTVLMLAGRGQQVKARRIKDARKRVAEILALLQEIDDD
jgi:hypothetical protein